MKFFMNANKNAHDAMFNMIITFGSLQLLVNQSCKRKEMRRLSRMDRRIDGINGFMSLFVLIWIVACFVLNTIL